MSRSRRCNSPALDRVWLLTSKLGRDAAVMYPRGVELLSLVQEGLLAEATAFRDANIVDVTSYEELKQAIEEGQWARGPWAGQYCGRTKSHNPCLGQLHCSLAAIDMLLSLDLVRPFKH